MYEVTVTLTCDVCGQEASDYVMSEESKDALNLIRDVADREMWELHKDKVLCYDCANKEAE